MNISLWINWWAERTPEKVAIRFQGQQLSYRRMATEINTMACMLQSMGVARGDRVAWLGYNHPTLLILLFACARIGALLVPLNFRLAPAEHAFMLQNAGASLLFIDARFAETATLVAQQFAECEVISTPAERFTPAELCLDRFSAVPDGPIQGDPVPSDCPLLIVYTSGTTGEPKGAVLTQDALHWNGLNSQFMHDLRRSDHVLTTLPFFHVGGLNIQTVPALRVGATVTLIEKFEPGEFLNLVAQSRPSLTVLVPTQMQAIAQHPNWRGADLSSLRMVTTGSTMVQIPLLDIWHEHDIPVIQVYGCTETGPIAIHQILETAHSAIGSVGQPARYCEIRIVDDRLVDQPAGQAGEILVRGRNILTEYWHNPEATRRSLKDGWLLTGDIGYRDETGRYFVVDRKKRVIISGGENIYPSELERILLTHPDVVEAVVIGFPDDKWGEIPAAALVLRGACELDSATLQTLFEDRVGRMKHPRHYICLQVMPKNAMGKIVLPEVLAQVSKQLADP